MRRVYIPSNRYCKLEDLFQLLNEHDHLIFKQTETHDLTVLYRYASWSDVVLILPQLTPLGYFAAGYLISSGKPCICYSDEQDKPIYSSYCIDIVTDYNNIVEAVSN